MITRRIAILGLLAVAGLSLVTVATAATKSWTGGSGNWDVDGNWSGGAAPVMGDQVNIVHADATARTITYNVAAPSLGLLTVNNSGSATDTLLLPNALNLNVTGVVVGGYTGSAATTGAGAINHSAGTLTASTSPGVILGHGEASSGLYTLSGAATLNSNSGSVYVGYNGSGTFNQVSGTVTISNNFLDLGRFDSGVGFYNLLDGSLTAREEYIGDDGIAQFSQYGGSNTVTGAAGLTIGWAAASNGSYSMTGGTLNVPTGGLVVGRSGIGSMSVSNGAVVTSASGTIGQDNIINASGTVNVSGVGSSWSTAGALAVGASGKGTLTIQNQGAVRVGTDLAINSNSDVNVNGGTLRFDTISGSGGLGRLHFNSGAIQLAGARSLDNSDTTITALFGTIPSISSNKELIVEGALSYGGTTTTIDGGKVKALAGMQIGFVRGGPFSTQARLTIGNGGTLTTSNAELGYETYTPGFPQLGIPAVYFDYDGYVTVSGANSLWDNPGNLKLGTNGHGVGTLDIVTGATVRVGGVLDITNLSTVNLLGGTLRFNTVTNPSRINFSAGTIQLAGDRAIGTDASIRALFGFVPTISTGKGLIIEESAILSTALTITGGTFKSKNLIISPGGAIDFDRGLLEITGGTITGLTSLAVPTNAEFRASGVQALRIAGAAGSTITASGNLTLGNSLAVNGFYTGGTLNVGANVVTLNDANDAAFDTGSLVSLGNGVSQGTINAANGLTLDFGGNIAGFGTVSTPNVSAKPLINNGHITGNSAAQRITLPGYVKGAGTFDNVNFTGTFSPGLSPAILSVGNIGLSTTSTLLVELGGSTPGSGYDQIQSSGALGLAGVLQVALINGFLPALGNQFTVLTFSSHNGDFTSYSGLTLGGHLTLKPSFTANSLVLTARPTIDGDINLDGVVNIFDINSISANWNTAGPQGDANGDGIVNIFDINLISANWGATGAVAVPEPGTVTLALLGLIGAACCRRRKIV